MAKRMLLKTLKSVVYAKIMLLGANRIAEITGDFKIGIVKKLVLLRVFRFAVLFNL